MISLIKNRITELRIDKRQCLESVKILEDRRSNLPDSRLGEIIQLNYNINSLNNRIYVNETLLELNSKILMAIDDEHEYQLEN